MKNVLFITYRYPPSGGAGVFRSLKFVKYLKRLGWNPLVLCARSPFITPKDPTLLKEIPADVTVHRVISDENPLWTLASYVLRINPKWLHTPDSISLWRHLAFAKAKDIIRKNKVNVVYTTSPPESAHLLGLKIKERFGIPWVIDYRDPWTDRFTYPTRWHKTFEENLERKIVHAADHNIVISEELRQNHINKFQLPEDRCTAIYNGFDPEDFSPPEPANVRNEKFTITYCGVFKKIYAHESFLHALRELAKEDQDFAQGAAFYKVGMNQWPYYRQLMGEIGQSMTVKDFGYVAYQKSITITEEADLLILTLASDNPQSKLYFSTANYVGGWATSKLYNYLAAKRPILAVVPLKSRVASIINATRTGTVVDPDDHAGIVTAIRQAFAAWKQGQVRYQPQTQALDQYSREAQTRTLMGIFDRLCPEKG